MGKFIDHTGQIFDRWTVISYSHSAKYGTYFNCRCLCGTEKVIPGYDLRRGHTKSCGCLSVELHTTHGLSGHPLYEVLRDMNSRCNNPNDPAYHNYGGRGIAVCDRWHRDNPDGLKNFIEDMYPTYKSGLTIDRINNNGNYTPENCKWSTMKEQNNNTRHNRLITYQNETRTLQHWSEKLGIKYATLEYRIFTANWTIEKALTTPTRKNKSITFQNETRTLQQWSEKLGIKYTTLEYRIFSLNWSIEKALTTPTRKNKSITYQNQTLTLPQWSEKLGIKYATLEYRITANWTIEKAFTK